MFQYQPREQPPTPYLSEYEVNERIKEICNDIAYRGNGSLYEDVYDYLFEYAESQILEERDTYE